MSKVFKKGAILRYQNDVSPIIVLEVLEYKDEWLTFRPLLTNTGQFKVGEQYKCKGEPEYLWREDTEYAAKRQFDKELEQLLKE